MDTGATMSLRDRLQMWTHSTTIDNLRFKYHVSLHLRLWIPRNLKHRKRTLRQRAQRKRLTTHPTAS